MRHISPILRDMGTASRKRRMKKSFLILAVLVCSSCSPRDFLTRRLAADLIASSDAFKASQQITLQTGVISNKDYLAPESLVLQHHGWISATSAPCPAGLVPPPCWNLQLTPSGVDTVRTVVSREVSAHPSFPLPVARREFLDITGISKQGSLADVDFTWHWVPLNEIGAALYSADMRYQSTVGLRSYDDGWRLMTSTPHSGQTLDDALKNAELVP